MKRRPRSHSVTVVTRQRTGTRGGNGRPYAPLEPSLGSGFSSGPLGRDQPLGATNRENDKRPVRPGISPPPNGPFAWSDEGRSPDYGSAVWPAFRVPQVEVAMVKSPRRFWSALVLRWMDVPARVVPWVAPPAALSKNALVS